MNAVKAYLESNDVRVDAVDELRKTALMLVSARGRAHVVDYLLQYKANIETTEGILGKTALMHASKSGQLNIVRLVLDWSADVEAPNECKQTILM